jgi:PKD repeat protein
VPGALPDIPVNTIVYDRNSQEGLYIGTQTGVMYKNSTMNNWVIFNSGLPVVDVRELEIFYSANAANNRLVAATYGRGLWRSDLYSPPNSPPVANFTCTPVNPCPGESVQLTDLSLNAPTSWTWSFAPNDVTYLDATNSHSQNPAIQFNQSRSYTVTLTAANSYGSSSTDTIVNVGGDPVPFSGSFESGSFPAGWEIVNPDDATTWAIADIGGNGSSTKAAYMNFSNYGSKGELDDMITPSTSLADALHPWLKFKVAYCRWSDGYSDGLEIFISTDCGNTWGATPVYSKSGLVLATVPDQQYAFIPAVPSDWRLDSVDLAAYTGGPVKIKFQAVNGFGNNLYIDDVSIAEQPVLMVYGVDVPAGQDNCYNASETIRVAGNGQPFSVQGGGAATFVAGLNVIFGYGTSVSPNGYLHGYITTNGQYCGVAKASMVAVIKESETSSFIEPTLFRVFPNPTSGKLTIELLGIDAAQPVRIEIYTTMGEKITTVPLSGNQKYELSLAERPAGLYFIRLVSGDYSNTQKIILSE